MNNSTLKSIRSVLYTYITLGTDESTSYNDLKKITLLHIFCNTWHLFTILSFIEDFFGDQLLLVSYPIMMFLVVSVQILLYHKKTFAASMIFIISLIGVTFFYSNYLYVAEMMEYYLLLPPAISLIYMDNKMVTISIFIICLLALYIPNLYFEHYSFSVLNNLNPPFLFFSMYIVMSYFKNLNIRNEKILEANTRELEELDEFKSQFFTNISHEIRAPLTIINGQISELEELAVTAPGVSDIQKGIKKQIRSITNMVDDVLDLAKMESSNFNLQLQPVNISELLYRQYLSFEPLYKQKGIVFNLVKNEEDYIAKIDTVFFEKAVNNTIVNALKYTDTGEVSITISQQKESLCIAISDTGIGIDAKDIDSVFNRFYQVNNDINKSGGSGVGLAFSKEIIELHHGDFLLDSELGKGSTFTILIPFEKTQPAALEIAPLPIEDINATIQQPIYGESAPKFLIVEDNYDMRKYLVSILPDYNCLEASNGLEALEIIEQESIDFVITDYMMPKLDGHEFVEKLKVANSTIPVIMLTAKTDTDTKLDVLKLGIDDYITKPFDKHELLVRINNCQRNNNDRNAYNKKHDITVEYGKDDFIMKLKDFIYNKSDDIKLNQEVLSEKFNLSKSSFYRKVKSQTGLSPNNFIREIRLQKARDILMKTPDILVKQLTLEAGFSHQAYFSKLYAERFGVKPQSRVNF